MATSTAKNSTFIWQGLDKQGRQTKGEVQSISQSMAKAQLRKQGIVAKKVKKKSSPLFGERKKPIKPADVAIFTRQLATMMKAGVPLVQGFEIVAEGLDNPSMRDLVIAIKNDVASGSGFAAW
jgi:type IV pilus assembly protein PilC